MDTTSCVHIMHTTNPTEFARLVVIRCLFLLTTLWPHIPISKICLLHSSLNFLRYLFVAIFCIFVYLVRTKNALFPPEIITHSSRLSSAASNRSPLVRTYSIYHIYVSIKFKSQSSPYLSLSNEYDWCVLSKELFRSQ
jgi:hypothetical protein